MYLWDALLFPPYPKESPASPRPLPQPFPDTFISLVSEAIWTSFPAWSIAASTPNRGCEEATDHHAARPLPPTSPYEATLRAPDAPSWDQTSTILPLFRFASIRSCASAIRTNGKT